MAELYAISERILPLPLFSGYAHQSLRYIRLSGGEVRRGLRYTGIPQDRSSNFVTEFLRGLRIESALQ
jgi:hypothetical protein